MTQMTDRVSNQKIVELAKQQYESQKRSKLPTVIVDLPSQGKIYPETHPLRSGQIEMRYMTAFDEDILTNASYIDNGVVFDKLLESIITTPVAVADIKTADKDSLIINARILAYGVEYPVKVTDPNTKKSIDRTLILSRLQNKPFDLQSDENGEFEYEFNNSGTDVVLKFIYINKDINEITISEFLSATITEVNGNRDKTEIDNFIRYEFLSKNAKEFRKYIAANLPGLDMTYEFEGEDGSTFNSTFPIGTDLFWF
jgi:hypothetical protein